MPKQPKNDNINNMPDGLTEDERVLYVALKNFDNAQLAYQSQRLEAREDLSFVAGNQYKSDQTGDDDYRLTVNLLGPFLRQITAEARSMNPSIRVVPVSTDADVDNAEVIGGMIRSIEQKCNSESVYQTALWYAAAGGEGYILLDSEYVDNETDDQDLIINACDNPEKVFLDPNHTKMDGSDSEWGFIIEDIDHGTYLRKFPNTSLADNIKANTWDRLTLPNDWMNQNTVRIARYWLKEYEMVKTWYVRDPVTLVDSYVNEEPGPDVVQLKKKPRESYKIIVKEYQLTAYEVLGETFWPGKYIPIVKVVGETFAVGGQKVQYGAIRMAKDPQRQYNYAVSRQTEMIDQAPKNSFVITEKQMGNHAEKWANANRVNYGALPYVNETGNAQPPFRVSGLDSNAFQGVAATRSQALEDMKLVFGIQDASLGVPGNETSGVAQQGRVEQSSRSTYQYFDHLLLSMKHLGRMIVNVIPDFYDTERTVRIVKPTDEDQLVIINSMKDKKRYDLTKGQYDVVISTGPAYASKRDMAHDQLMDVQNAVPGAPIGDLIAGLIDDPISKIAAARIKATYPPAVIAATGEDNQSDMAPKEQVTALQQQLAQIQPQMQALQMQNKELHDRLIVAADKTSLELTKTHLDDEQKKAQLKADEQESKAEFYLKKKELALKEKQLALADRQMKLNEMMAAHKAHESTKPNREDYGNVDSVDTNIDTNISAGPSD